MKNSYSFCLLFILLVLFPSCDELDTNNLDVDNLNELSNAATYLDPSEYAGLIDDSYLKFWQAIQLSVPSYPVSVMAQGGSSSWGGWGTRDVGTIPRQALQNTEEYVSRGLFSMPWTRLYTAIIPVNDILRVISEEHKAVFDGNGKDITDQVIANGKALQGLVLGYLSLVYDRAFISDETTDLSDDLVLSPYGLVNQAAITKLEEAIAIFANSDYEMSGWNGLTYVGNEAAALLSGFVAKFEVAKARNSDEIGMIDWNKVMAYTSNEPVDLAPMGDGIFWWTRMLIQGQSGLRYRVSQKVIRMMNPSKSTSEVPYPWPDGVETLPEIVNPDDQRINIDFTYSPDIAFVGDRGYYFFSTYYYSRYISYVTNQFLEPMSFLMAPEVELLRAEALIRTGADKVAAAAIINKTRVGRGALPPLTGLESEEDLLNAITYERIVEFTWQGSCNVWFYRRMVTPPNNADADNLYYLEPRTSRHFPIPAEELSVLGMQVYTFGGHEAEQ